jgi:hypothetical protein
MLSLQCFGLYNLKSCVYIHLQHTLLCLCPNNQLGSCQTTWSSELLGHMSSAMSNNLLLLLLPNTLSFCDSALQALQSRRSSGATAAVAGASHIQQIHIGGRRSPVPGGQSPRVSPLPGRSAQSSPIPGRSPRTSPPRERLPPSRPGGNGEALGVVPHVARSIQSSTTGSVSGKSVDAPAAPPANAGTSVGGNGWLWGNSPAKK